MNDRIRFFLNWEEYFAAQEFLRRIRYPIAPEKILGGGLTLLAVLWNFFSGLTPFSAVPLAAGLAAMFGAPQLRRWASKRKWEREPLYQAEHTVSVSEEGIHFLMGRVESNLDWGYYQRMVESPGGFLLVCGHDAFNFFPKRAFGGESVINEFRALAAKKIRRHSQ